MEVPLTPLEFARRTRALYPEREAVVDGPLRLNYAQFFEHYAFVVRELFRLTLPGRMTAVHCMDVPSGNSGTDHLIDFPGDIIRLHEREGWKYIARYAVWKEPLGVRNRTMAKNLAHKTIVEDSSRCTAAAADYLLVFRRKGQNQIPIAHPNGLLSYAGERKIPTELMRYKGWNGNQIENRYSHWIWRQYASAFWDDVRIDQLLQRAALVAVGFGELLVRLPAPVLAHGEVDADRRLGELAGADLEGVRAGFDVEPALQAAGFVKGKHQRRLVVDDA